VLGEQAFADDDDNDGGNATEDSTSPSAAPAQQQQLPTAVNAGLDQAQPVGPSLAQALLGALLVLLGGVCARLGWLRARG
jgi:hypothetical protein